MLGAAQQEAAVPDRHLLIDVKGGVVTLTLNRPDKRNALSLGLMTDLIDQLEAIGSRRDVRVVILAGSGPAFCAGHDLAELIDRDINDYRRTFDVCTQLMATLQSIPQPVIARVHGTATAAGCQLAASCDLVVAADTAHFATPGVKIGLFCTTPMVALTRAVGRKRALEMLLTGVAIDATTAAEWGLVNRVVPADRLEAETVDLAAQIAAASSLTIAIGKQAFYAQIDLDQPKAYSYAKEIMTMNALSADAQEGMSAFTQKRSPCWTGR
jgi:enoyl-CoA hydratase/carnithine racemase